MKSATLLLAAAGAHALNPIPALTYTVQPVASSWEDVVYVTSTRTFTDFCGCGIPGVPTISNGMPIGPTLISTTSRSTSPSSSTTSTTTGTFSFNPTLISTTSSTTSSGSTSTSATLVTSSGSTVILPIPTVTTSITTMTTTTTDTAVVSPTLISTTSSSTTSSVTSSSTTTSTTSGGGIVSPVLGTTSSTTSTTTTRTFTAPPINTSTTTTDPASTATTTTSSTDTTVSTSSTTTTDSTSTASTTTTTSTTSDLTSSTSSSTTSTTTSSIITTTTASTTTTTTTAATTTTTTAGAVVTDEAYIDTVLRHHNVHRANHTVANVVWSPSLASTAQKIASGCIYQHNTTADGGGYGQNIGAGYPSTSMGQFITEGLYNSEVNSYTYYGGEPDTSTVGAWGHFSQVVWKATTSVGCYTQDCSATGLQNAPGIPPYFTVCNYSPAGNVVGAFGANVLRPVGNPTVFGNYECPTAQNCVGPTT